MTQGERVYNRSVYLIDPGFQLRFAFYIGVIVFFASLIYPFTIYDLMDQFAQLSAQYSPEVVAKVKSQQGSLVLLLVLWQIGLSLLMFIVGIFFAHKISGPLYKLRAHLRSIKDGQLPPVLKFRKGDYFQDLAADFNDAYGTLQEEYRKDFVYLDEIQSYLKHIAPYLPIEEKESMDEIQSKLFQMLRRFEKV